MPLSGFTFLTSGGSPAVAYAGRLLILLGAEVVHVGLVPAWGALVPTSLQLADARTLTRLPVAGAIDGAGLLSVLAAPAPYPVVAAPSHGDPLADWASSGAMALTGQADGPALDAPGWTASYLCGAALVGQLLAKLTGGNLGEGDLALDGAALLGERAALTGLHRRGSVSVGGASRLLPASDGWVAVSLARPSDFEALEAWIGRAWAGSDPWEAIAEHVAAQRADEVIELAQLLGLAAAVAASPERAVVDEQARARGQRWPPSPWLINDRVPTVPTVPTVPSGASGATGDQVRQLAGPDAIPPSRHATNRGAPLVVDLSALWAGPLCASLLGLAGARVIKVETESRSDGARRGPPAFFDLLNAGKESVVLPLGTAAGQAQLGHLIEAADIVIESARPRVMAQWGFDVERIVSARRDLAWVSITAYGRTGPWHNRVGFGDDSAVAAGFTTVAGDIPYFCADAYADPVTGLHAAVAALAALVGGGAHLFDIALREVVGHLLTHHDTRDPLTAGLTEGLTEVAPPRARPARGNGPSLGVDSERVSAELGLGLGWDWD